MIPEQRKYDHIESYTYKVLDYILCKQYLIQQQSGKPLTKCTAKRLNQLLFLSDKVYRQVSKGKKLVDQKYFLWDIGPCIPSIFFNYCQILPGAEPKLMVSTVDNAPKIKQKHKKIIDFVLEKVKDYDTEQLCKISKKSILKGSPFKQERLVDENEIYNKKDNSFEF